MTLYNKKDPHVQGGNMRNSWEDCSCRNYKFFKKGGIGILVMSNTSLHGEVKETKLGP